MNRSVQHNTQLMAKPRHDWRDKNADRVIGDGGGQQSADAAHTQQERARAVASPDERARGGGKETLAAQDCRHDHRAKEECKRWYERKSRCVPHRIVRMSYMKIFK